jgi:hypothetical protein
MNYLLINPPLYDVLPFVGMSQPAHLLRLGAYLKARGDTVQLFDFEPVRMSGADRVSEESEMVHPPVRTNIVKTYGNTGAAVVLTRYGKPAQAFEDFLSTSVKPDRILVTSLMTFHYRGVHEAVELCKKAYPDVEVTLGGVYPSLCPEHAARSLADRIFVGEIPEANAMQPDLSLLDHVPEYAVIKTRWGCPNRCSYCAVHKMEGRVIRSVPPEIVFEHIKNLHTDHGIRYFYFWDSNALVGWKDHLGRLLRMLRHSNLDIELEFTYGFQPDLLTRDICMEMRDSAVADIFPLPIESSDERLCRERFHRRTRTADLRKAVDLLREVGYRNMMFYVLVGMPEQPFESVIESCELAWELEGKPIILPFTPIPGTEEYENYAHLIDGKDLEDLMPGLLPFCTNESQMSEWLQIRQYSMLLAEETRDLLSSNLHVKAWQSLNQMHGAATTC